MHNLYILVGIIFQLRKLYHNQEPCIYYQSEDPSSSLMASCEAQQTAIPDLKGQIVEARIFPVDENGNEIIESVGSDTGTFTID